MSLRIMALLIPLALTAGCKTMAKVLPVQDEPKAGTYVRQRADLPVPVGYSYEPDDSFRHHTNFEASRYVYVDRSIVSPMERLVDFYEQQLPKFGWKLVFIYGRKTRKLIAEKGDETCEITLARKFRDRKTLVIMKVSREPGLAAAKTEAPSGS